MDKNAFNSNLRDLLRQQANGIKVAQTPEDGTMVSMLGKPICNIYLHRNDALIFTHNSQRVIDFAEDAWPRSVARSVADYLRPLIRRRVARLADLSDEIRSELDPILPEP